jgi:phytanoyl-CoA hydroxylase
MLSKHQISQYWDQGFLIVPNVVSTNTLTIVNNTLLSLIESSRAIAASDAVFDLEDGHTAEEPRVRRIKEPHRVDPVFDQLLRCSEIVDLVSQLLGPNLRMDHTKLNIKPAGGGEAVQWHQDWAFYPYTNDDMLEVGIMLAETNSQNGPLLMIPKSHQGPVYDHNFKGYFAGAIGVDSEGLDLSSAVPCLGSPGTITLHHVRTVHGSATNNSDGARPILLLGYCAADAWPLREGSFGDLESFNGKMIRGKPTLQPRLKDVPVRMPYPIAPDQGWKSIFETQKQVGVRGFVAR